MHKMKPDPDLLIFTTQLPALPQALIRLLDVCNDPDTDIAKVSEAVARDVTITAKILSLANSAFLGARSKFTSIDQAVIYLGMDTVRNLAISISVHETFKDKAQSLELDIEEFWYHSLLTALLAKEIAELHGTANAAEAYLCGFLHDIGKYLLNLCCGKEYGALLQTFGIGQKLLSQERALLGISHPEAGTKLIQHWKLGDSLAEAIGKHHCPPDDLSGNHLLAKITALANLLANNSYTEQPIIQKTATQLEISTETLATLRAEQLETISGIANSLGIAVSAPQDLAVNDEAAAAGSSENSLQGKVQSLAQVSGLLDNLIRAKTLNRAFLILEESLQILFDINKCILLLPDEENIEFTSHGSFRNRFPRKLKGLQISVTDDTSFINKVIKERKSIRLDCGQSASLSELEALLLDTFEEQSLFAVPFTICEKHCGVLVLVAVNHAEHSFVQIEGTVALLLSHIGSRLNLERHKNRQAEALAQERTATVQAIARTLSHEIATPLSIIQNYVSLLGNSAESGGPSMHEGLNIIKGELARIGKISLQLNNLSAPPQPNGMKLINVDNLISETLQLFEQSARVKKNVSVTARMEANSPEILTRPDCLKQILINLLSNSLDAVTTNGWIRVDSRMHAATGANEKNKLSITVADNGSGINPAITDNLFRAGYSTKGDGHAGLGLAIVKKLANDLQGKISHSTGENGETLFTLELLVTDVAAS